MNYQDKNKDNLKTKLQKRQQEFELFKKSYLKEVSGHKETEDDLQISKDQFQKLFSEMLQGSALHEMIYNDKGKAVDYVTLDINKSFETIMNVRREQVIGKLASSILPDRELKKWLAIFAPVARGGGPKNYKQYSQLNNKYFEGVVFSPKQGHFWVTFNDFTKRRFAEWALQKSEEKWRKLVSTIPNFIALHDLEGKYLFLNHYADGFSEKDVIGKSLYEFISEDSRDEYRSNFKNCLRTKQTQHFIFYGFGNNTEIRIYENYLVPILEKDQIVNVMAIATDITERKNTEEAFRKLSLRHEAILASVPEIIMEVDNNKVYTWANRAGLEFFGNDVIGKEASFYFRGEQKTYDIVKPLFDGIADIFYLESWQQRHDGETRLLGWWCRVLKDDEGNVTGALSSARDITERIKIEAEISEAALYTRKLIEASLDPLVTISKEGKITDVNMATENITGIKRKKLIGSDFSDYFTDTENAKEGYRIVFSKGVVKDYPLTILHKNGRKINVLYNATLFKNEAGEIQGVFAAARDITYQKKMEEKLLRSKTLLERLNQHLNEVRENERALISREIHDELGQSMTALKLDLSRMHPYISANNEAVKKLEDMIELISNTIKNVQRISSDLRPGILDDLGLVAAFEWYCDEFKKRTGIPCEFKFDDPDFRDTKINLVLFRVLQETLTNVIRHAMATSVSINLYKTTKGTTLIIQDNGIGIPEGKIESPRSLGLISMRERVRQFGGKINISSGKGKGTRLLVFIPEKKKSAL
jgi:PAS domain S-box-containing protein